MNECLPQCTCLQNADNYTIYQHCKVKPLKIYCINVEKDLLRLLNQSTNNNLVFNATITKLMLLAMAQRKACHNLDEIQDLEMNIWKSN